MTYEIRHCTRDEFIHQTHSDRSKENNFAKTFVAKADFQDIWYCCFGLYANNILCGAQITTVSKRFPYVANLQLLHTFPTARGKGYGEKLSNFSLRYAKNQKAKYWRVSSEIGAIKFYTKIGVPFVGEQKSGCLLSIFRITSTKFSENKPDINDDVIYNAINRLGKGGCIKTYPEYIRKDLFSS